MPRLSLHIGHFKTGTSAIQSWCSENAAHLLQYGLLYPASGRAVNNPTTHAGLSLELYRKCGGTPPGWYTETGPMATFEKIVDEIRAESMRFPDHDVLVSTEELWRLAQFKSSVEARGLLLEAFDGFDINIIMYIREPFEWLNSWYNQAQKDPVYALSFIDYLLELPDSYLDPWIVYRYWADVLGEEKVTVCRYGETGRSHLQGFLSACGFPSIPVPAVPEDPNPALDLDVMESLRLWKVLSRQSMTAAASLYQSVSLADEHLLEQLRQRLDRLTQANQLFFETHFSSYVAPLTLEKIIAHHHRIHHQDRLLVITPEMVSDTKRLAGTLRGMARNMESNDPKLAKMLADMAESILAG